MKSLSSLFAVGTLLAFLAMPALAQEDQIRGGWLESRSRLERREKPSSRPSRQPRTEKPVSSQTAAQPATQKEPETQLGLGIGYTLFKKNAAGEFVRASTQEVFKSGDLVRLLVETNLDGYLYIFSREEGQAPVLLYPNSQVQNGTNFVQAHQTFWLPEDGEIEFDGNPAKETLTLVFSEKPVADLAASNSLEGTPVDQNRYNEIARETEVQRVGNLTVGLRLTTEEGQRKVRIRKQTPAPAYILVNRDANQSRIVANIQLTRQ